jgi:hypothetical protein
VKVKEEAENMIALLENINNEIPKVIHPLVSKHYHTYAKLNVEAFLYKLFFISK